MLDAHQLLWTQIAAGVCTLIFAGLLFNMFRVRRHPDHPLSLSRRRPGH